MNIFLVVVWLKKKSLYQRNTFEVGNKHNKTENTHSDIFTFKYFQCQWIFLNKFNNN